MGNPREVDGADIGWTLVPERCTFPAATPFGMG
jgi:hypothetical protein